MPEGEWISDREHVIRSISGDKVFPGKEHIFIIEMDTIHDARHPHVSFVVLVRFVLFSN